MELKKEFKEFVKKVRVPEPKDKNFNKENIMFRLAGITESLQDAESIAAIIWFQGCDKHCLGCHSPEVADLQWERGFWLNFEAVKAYLERLVDWVDWFVLSGGEPLMQPEAVKALGSWAKEKDKKVWIYTGDLFEKIPQDIKDVADVIVDGLFVQALQSPDLKFRGSSNQKLYRKSSEGEWKEWII